MKFGLTMLASAADESPVPVGGKTGDDTLV
jgi:hypothetical protein